VADNNSHSYFAVSIVITVTYTFMLMGGWIISPLEAAVPKRHNKTPYRE